MMVTGTQTFNLSVAGSIPVHHTLYEQHRQENIMPRVDNRGYVLYADYNNDDNRRTVLEEIFSTYEDAVAVKEEVIEGAGQYLDLDNADEGTKERFGNINFEICVLVPVES